MNNKDLENNKKKVSNRYPHKKVNLRKEDIEGMIETYEFLMWNNDGEDKKHCQRVLRQLKKSIKNI